MNKIFVGYGEQRGHRLNEISLSLLQTLAKRYPLDIDGKTTPAYRELVVTIAIHAEVKRRETGGKEQPHLPSIRELAEDIIKKGFQQASKLYHPDTQGQHAAQVLLGQTRDLLKQKCKTLPDFDSDKDAIVILQNSVQPLEEDIGPMDISDEDIPF